MANYSKIKLFDIANGFGIRTSIFFSGCDHHCKNCFNKELWDFNVGERFTEETYATKIKPTITKHIAGLSILGGEPMHPHNISATIHLVEWFKEDFPNKNIWLWSGYTMKELVADSNKFREKNFRVLEYIDALVDGKYIEGRRNLNLMFRGSSNQIVWKKQNGVWMEWLT